MLPDHHGEYFQQENAELIPLEIVDVDDKLVPPGETLGDIW